MTHAELFLQMLGGDKFSFQTFDDKKQKPYLAKHIYKSLNDAREQLLKLNSQGAGVFVTINETDGLGRRKGNITKVRALFADLDGSPIGPILSAQLEPHMIIESSKNKYHAYWLVDDCPLDQFSTHQKAIARRFDSDPSVCDLPRVMRLPGFNHLKDVSHKTTIQRVCKQPVFHLKDISRGLSLAIELIRNTPREIGSIKYPSSSGATGGFVKGSRNNDLFKVACAMRGRGESKTSTEKELLGLNIQCVPPLPGEEVTMIVASVWRLY